MRNSVEITKELFLLADSKHRDFQAGLMPTVPKERIIGIRTPVLRKYAKKINPIEAQSFLSLLPHSYYEEDNLHAFLIEQINDFDVALAETERFLPYIDNWATCDSFLPNAFKKEPVRLKVQIDNWLKSEDTYTVRYGVKLLIQLFLDGLFDCEQMHTVASLKNDNYYVKMVVAWYFATALAKQYDAAIIYIKDKKLSPWVHNKSIQKAIESYRIPSDIKEYLKTLKI